MLALDMDPKLAWAINHRELFPVNLNKADYESILRVPGIGVINAKRILKQRRVSAIRFDDLAKLKLSVPKVSLFVETLDHHPAPNLLEENAFAERFKSPESNQLNLF